MEEARTWTEILPAYEDRGLDMAMVSIDPYETESSIASFYDGAGIAQPLPTVVEGEDLARRFGVTALETTLILDGEGREVYRDAKITDAQTIERVLAERL